MASTNTLLRAAGLHARRRRAFVLAIAAALAPAGYADAQTRTWDRGAGNGNWSASFNWSGDVEPGGGNAVIFPTPIPAGDPVITLSNGEMASSLTFDDSYTLTGGNLTRSNASITVASGMTATINSLLQGPNGLTKSGDGTLILGGTNTYTGITSISGGELQINAIAGLGASSSNITITNDARLRASGSFSSMRAIVIGGGGGGITVNSGQVVTLNNPLQYDVNTFTADGAGTLVLTQAVFNSGTAHIANGTVRLTEGLALTGGTVTFASAGRLELSSSDFQDPLSLPASTSGSIRGIGTSTFSGIITAAAGVDLSITTGASTTDTLNVLDYTGGAGSTTHVTGSGSVVLPGSNSYSGAWAVDAGTLVLAHANAITAASSANVNSGGTLLINNLNATGAIGLNNGGIVRGTGAATFSGTMTAATSASDLTLATGTTPSDTFTVTNYTGGSGSTTHVTGSGEVILPNSNSYSGGWAVDSGTLRLDNATSAGAGSSPIVVNSGGTLRLHGATITRNVTMNNGSTLVGSFNGATTGRPNGTLSIAPAAAVTFRTGDNLHTMLIGDSTNDLTGGGGGSTITIAPDSPVALLAASNYVGDWILQSSVQPGNDNRFGNAGNTVTLDSGGLLLFNSFTTSRQFIIAGTSALQVFGGTMTFNTGLTGTFDTLQTSGDGVVLNAAGSVTGNGVFVDGILKVNHNSALGSVPFEVFGGGGQLELGTGVTLSQNATMHNTAVVRGNNNTLYGGTITVDTVGGDDITLATVSSGDTFTIGDGANDLTGGGAGTVITAAGPGRVKLTQSSNVTADWLVTGGVLEINGGDRLGTTNGVTVNGVAALQLTGTALTNTPLTISNGALWASGTSSYAASGGPKFANSASIAAITVLGASDVLSIDSPIRNVSAAASSTTINVNGPGHLMLTSGAETGADIFSGSWVQSAGLLQVGNSNGVSINALGFKNGDSKQANSIRVNGGTLAVGVFGSGFNTPHFLRANVTLNSGSIAATNGLSAFFGGDFILEANSTSRVLVFDPVNATTETDVHLTAGAAGADNNAAITDWRFNSQLIVDPGTNFGGQFTIQRDGGTVSVDGSVCALIINENADVVLGGTADALSDGVDHVNVVNDGTFIVTQGSKNIGSLSGSSSGITLTFPSTSLTVHQHVSAPAGLIGNSGSFIKEGPGTLSVFSIGGGAITINDGAIISSSGPAVESGESITLSGGDLTLPSLYSNGQVTINSGSTLTTDLLTAGNDGSLTGGTGTGTITMTGGTVSAKKVLLGSSAGGTGNFVMNGGTLLAEKLAANAFIVNGHFVTITQPAFPDDPVMDGSIVAGYVHDGSIVFNGGFVTVPKIKLGVTAGKTGSFTQNGGIHTINTLGVGNDGTTGGGAGTGVFVFNSGGLDLTNLIIGSSSGGVGEATVGLSDGNTVLKVATLAIDSGAGNKLDLTNGKLMVTGDDIGSWNGSEYTGITGLIQRGLGNGTWNGSGIVTSMSDATTGVLTTLAIGDADELGYAGGSFGGHFVSSGDVLVMYTWGGDAQLDGDLDGDDYFQIDSNVAQSGSVFGFHKGDFNYDGLINGDDYFIIDSNIAFAQTQPNFPTGASAGGALTAVPEPGATAALLALMSSFAARRRRA